jgi:hypothetical protein
VPNGWPFRKFLYGDQKKGDVGDGPDIPLPVPYLEEVKNKPSIGEKVTISQKSLGQPIFATQILDTLSVKIQQPGRGRFIALGATKGGAEESDFHLLNLMVEVGT